MLFCDSDDSSQYGGNGLQFSQESHPKNKKMGILEAAA
jgi:hypothetical protein